MSPTKINPYLLLILISLIWGSQFIFTTFALKDFSFLWIAISRSVIGAVTLSLILFLFPQQRCTKINNYKRYLFLILIIGLLDAAIPFTLLTWGQQHVNSSIASILVGTIPIFTAIFASTIFRSERIHLGTVFAIIFGFCGIFILVVPDLSGSLSSFTSNIIGELAILGAAVSFAISMILIKRLSSPPIRAARDILVAASLQLFLLLFFLSEPLPTQIHASSIFSIFTLGILNTGIVYVFFVVLIHSAGSTFASFGNYLVPLIGVLLGVLCLGNPFTRYEFSALALIITGLFLNNYFGTRSEVSLK